MGRIFLSLFVFLGAAIMWSCAASDPQAQKIARGKYLVENVGMCTDCHTPRNDKGELDQTRWLQGGPHGFVTNPPTPNWAAAAPWIAGLPNISEADAVQLLKTGSTTKGVTKRPPMPPFRFSHEDAEAVVAYLKSLGTGKK